jgi:hypothetical protein
LTREEQDLAGWACSFKRAARSIPDSSGSTTSHNDHGHHQRQKHRGVSSSRRSSKAAIAATYLLYLLVIYVGLMGLLTAYAHVFRPVQTSASIGWSTSPYEYEVGMADLTVGVLGICCLWATRQLLVGNRDCEFGLAAGRRSGAHPSDGSQQQSRCKQLGHLPHDRDYDALCQMQQWSDYLDS